MLKKAFTGTTGAIRGSSVAADSLIQAFIRESDLQILLIVHSSERDAAITRLETCDLPEDRKHLVRVVSIDDIVAGKCQIPRLKAWFNPLPATPLTSIREGVELSQVFRRACFETLFPVTMLTHGLSYHPFLYGYYLRLLLEGTYECDSIICTSRASQAAMRKIVAHIESEFEKSFSVRLKYNGRIDLIPLCVDVTSFVTHGKIRARAQLKLSKDSFLILMLGRLSPFKADLYPFLPVLKSLVERNPGRKIEWIVAGTEDEGYALLLQKYATSMGLKDNLRILLEVSDCTKSLLMQASDIFVSPTDCVTESFGISIIEAMAAGLPQVVPDWDGYRDTVHHGETGFLIETRWMNCCDDMQYTGTLHGLGFDQFALGQSVAIDMQQMEYFIQLLLSNESLRRQMAERSRNIATEKFSFKTVSGHYKNLWRDLEATARSCKAQPERARFTQPRYYQFFGHYASKALSDSTTLRISSTGRIIRNGDKILPLYPSAVQTYQTLSEAVLHEMLELIQKNEPSSREATADGKQIGSLLELIMRSHAGHTDSFRRHILWLLKYGLLEVVKD
jgi:glycosyltransferase involved in cell wall biosynthesis